jgi:hypothetical protein
MMRHIVIEKVGRWDLALACASLSLVMLVLTGVLYSQHHKSRAAPVLVSTFSQLGECILDRDDVLPCNVLARARWPGSGDPM